MVTVKLSPFDFFIVMGRQALKADKDDAVDEVEPEIFPELNSKYRDL